MGELFVCEEDSIWSSRIRLFGQALGKFIYMMDACVDLEKDKKQSRYNPFIKEGHDALSEEDRLLILKMHIGECARLFELFPLLQDLDIMRNILFSGVWHRYTMATRKNKEDTQVDK